MSFLEELLGSLGSAAEGDGAAFQDMGASALDGGLDSWALEELLRAYGGAPSAPEATDNALSRFLGGSGMGDPGAEVAGAYSGTAPYQAMLARGASSEPSPWSTAKTWLSKLMEGDKATLGQARFGMGALGLLGSLLQSRKARNSLSPAQLQSMLNTKFNQWTPAQQQSFNNYFYQPLPQLPYQQPKPPSFAHGGSTCGALGLLQGGAAGQADNIDARLSAGEYVVDADVVSALGDGNNEAGAAMLDEMRERVREHKRSAPPDSIPPPALSPLAYMQQRKA